MISSFNSGERLIMLLFLVFALIGIFYVGKFFNRMSVSVRILVMLIWVVIAGLWYHYNPKTETLNNMGVDYYDKQDYEKAVEYYRKAKDRA